MCSKASRVRLTWFSAVTHLSGFRIVPSTQYPQVEQLGLQATPLKGKKQLLVSLFFTFWPRPIACGILVTRSGAEPMPPALESQSLNHWDNREVLKQSFLDQNQVIACILSCLGSSHLTTEITQILILKIWSQVFKTSALKWHRGCHSPCSLPLALGST